MNNKGFVYLIKFEKKYKHANYYIGFSYEHPSERYKRHKNGGGARLLKVLNDNNIDYFIVRIWVDVDKNFERKIKNWNNSKKHDLDLSYLPTQYNNIKKKRNKKKFEDSFV